jgi:hypothetical protein
MADHAFVYSGEKYLLKLATPDITTNKGAINIKGTIFDLFTFVNSIFNNAKQFTQIPPRIISL